MLELEQGGLHGLQDDLVSPMASDGRGYELLTRTIFQQIVAQSAARTIQVKHDVVLDGKTTSHQIDVYWEFEFGDVIYKTIAECKDWSKAVTQGELLKFKAVLDDLLGQPRGIFVTRAGYQSGARQVAGSNGIILYELRETPADGRIRQVILQLRIQEPLVTSRRFIPDDAWYCGERDRVRLASMPDSPPFPVDHFEDEDGRQTWTIRRLADHMLDAKRTLGSETLRHCFTQATFVRTGVAEMPRLKVSAFEITAEIQESVDSHSIFLDDVPMFILRNVADGAAKLFDGNVKLISP